MMPLKRLSDADPDVARLIREETRRQAEGLELIASENFVSPAVLEALGSPLTNMRYTGHHRGAIYGWDQTLNNSGNRRVGHGTTVKGLYLAEAWSSPGHGYGGVIPSGLECFGEIVRSWS